MAVSRLIRMDPYSVVAAYDVALERVGVETKLEIEPCGEFAWVTSDSGCETEVADELAARYDAWVLDQIEHSVQSGLECGALPLPEPVLRILQLDPPTIRMAGFSSERAYYEQ